MFQVDPRMQASIWGVIIVIVLACWAAYGILSEGNQIFLAVMLVLSLDLTRGWGCCPGAETQVRRAGETLTGRCQRRRGSRPASPPLTRIVQHASL